MSADLVESVRLAYAELHGLCDGSRKFTMSIPVRPEQDSDMVIGHGLDAASAALTEAEALRAQIAAAQAREQEARRVLERIAERGCIRVESTSGHDEVFEAHADSVNEAAAAIMVPTDTTALRDIVNRAVCAGVEAGMSRETTKLGPCPFCGKQPETWDGDEYRSPVVYCDNDKCVVGVKALGATIREAIAAWNRRATPEQPR